jgi:murein DD-endopeptidase MepM/ murein hydrolase activator NlpD
MFDGGSWRRATAGAGRWRASLTGLLVVVIASAALPVSSAELTPGLDEARTRARDTTQQLAEAESRLNELDQELVVAQGRTDEVRAQVEALEVELGDAAVTRFIRSGTTPSLLESEDWIRQVRGIALGRSATEHRGDIVEDYTNLVADLQVSEADIQAKRAEQDGVRAQLEARAGELQAELVRLEDLERQAQEAQRTGALGPLRGAEVDAATDGAAPQPSAPGQLAVCPVAGPHTFIDSWGFARSGGRRHKGVDMMAAIGVPIVAPVSGTVTDRGNSVGGMSFHLEGDDGNYYYGTHLSRYGATGHVQAGDVIGYVGDSGNARGIPHLHFEVHPGGQGNPVDPYPYVAAVCH